VVKEEDSFGNVITTDSTHTVTAARNLGTGTLQGTLTLTLASGVASFTNLSYQVAETINIAFTTTAGAATSATSTKIVVSPAAATKVVFVQQPTNAIAGVAISPAVTAKVEDQFNNVVTSDSSTVTLTLSTGTFEGGSTTATAAAASGVATFSTLKIDVAGSYTVSATDGSLTAATSSSFTISAAAASQLVFGQQPTSANAGVVISPAVTVKVEDQFNNVTTTTTTVGMAIGTNPGGGTLGGTTSVTTS